MIDRKKEVIYMTSALQKEFITVDDKEHDRGKKTSSYLIRILEEVEKKNGTREPDHIKPKPLSSKFKPIPYAYD